jgi:hypothetical protein
MEKEGGPRTQPRCFSAFTWKERGLRGQIRKGEGILKRWCHENQDFKEGEMLTLH